MEAYRIRTIHTNGDISVLDKAFSQTIEMIKDLSKEDKEKFWDKKAVILPSGENIVFMREV